jgi:hypothetical protein
MLGDELLLQGVVVVDGDVGEAGLAVEGRGVRGGGRQIVSEHLRDDEEVLVRVESHAPDQPLVLPVPPGIPGWVGNDVALVLV